MTDRSNTLPQLPKNWVWTTLGNIGVIAAGGTPSTNEPDNFNGNVPWITPVDLSGFHGKFISKGKRNLSEKGLNSSSAILLPAGTVLFSSRAPIGYVAIAANPVSTNQGFKNLTCYEGIFDEYVFHYLKGSKRLAESYGSGTTFKEVSASRFARIPFPLCPYPEQRRIVSRIEELFSDLGAGVESLEKIKKQLKRYFQVVLKYAFEGKLTEDWRKAQHEKAEPARKLLDMIDKRKLGLKGKIKESHVNISGGAIPEGWVLGSLDQLSERIVDCLHSTPKFVSTGKYCVDTNCIEPNKILFEKSRFVSEVTYRDRVRRLVPKAGDVLFAREGTIGTAVVVPEDVELCLGQRMMMFRPEKEVLPRFFIWGLLSPFFEKQWKIKTTGSTVNHINIGDLRSMLLPLANMDEQKIIAEEVDRRFSIIDEMKNTLEICLGYADLMRRSILKNAFEGKLVGQDSTDEPAERLIERIRLEKARCTTSAGDGDSSKKLGLMDYVQ